MHHVFVGLGSNLGDRQQFMESAIRELQLVGEIKAVSAVYETEPYGMSSPNQFLNAVVELYTALEPPELLRMIKNVEGKLGRAPRTHMKDRQIDLDILLYENLYYEEHDEQSIEVPHPDLPNRRFVLVPLDELASRLRHPVFGETIHTILQRCADRHSVMKSDARLHIPILE